MPRDVSLLDSKCWIGGQKLVNGKIHDYEELCEGVLSKGLLYVAIEMWCSDAGYRRRIAYIVSAAGMASKNGGFTVDTTVITAYSFAKPDDHDLHLKSVSADYADEEMLSEEEPSSETQYWPIPLPADRDHMRTFYDAALALINI